MASTRITTRWTAAEAERIVEAWRESAESMRAFARGRGFDVQRLACWMKRLGEWSGGDERSGHFAPAVISTSGTPRVSVRLAEGILIEVAEIQAVPTAWVCER